MAREPILDNPLEQYLREVNQYKLLTREEEYELARRFAEDGDAEAARSLVTANLRFVVKVAYQFNNYDIKLTDLVQEGNIGLMKAVQRFNPDRGYRLISYAVWWIKAYIQNYIINTWSMVRVGPVAQQRKVLFGRRELPPPAESGHGPVIDQDGNLVDDMHGGGSAPRSMSPEETLAARMAQDEETSEEATFLIAAESGDAPARTRRRAPRPQPEEVERWRKAAMAARRDMNLDGSISEDGRLTLAETLSAGEPSAEEQLSSAQITAEVADRVAELHADLNEKEMTILADRLLADEPRTLQDVGDEYGISRERVRQIEANLKRKIAKRLQHLSPVALLEAPR